MRGLALFLVGGAVGAAAVVFLVPGGKKMAGQAKSVAEGKWIHYRHQLADLIEDKTTHLTNLARGRSHQLAQTLRS